MKFHGTLVRWNDARGFGFIQPTQADNEIFVHILSFPRDGRRPETGEKVWFEIWTDPDGKPSAINISRIRDRKAILDETKRAKASNGLRLESVLVVLVLVAAGAYAWTEYGAAFTLPENLLSPEASWLPASDTTTAPAVRYACDGRTHCSTMRSCDEAQYFLQHCPNTQMDGDYDGVPCESQWCH